MYYLILWQCTMQIALHNQRCCVQSCCSTSWASNSPDSSHPFHPDASPPFPAQITWCNLHAPSRCRRWWMPAIRMRPLQIQESTFMTPDNIISCSTGFHSPLTRSTALVLVLMKARKWCFIAYPCTSLFVSRWCGRSLLHFCFSLAAETQFLDRTRQVFGCGGQRVKP